MENVEKMKVLKPFTSELVVDKNTIVYTNGYDNIEVSPIPDGIEENARRDYSIVMPDGTREHIAGTIHDVLHFVGEQFYSPIEKRYTVEEFEYICKRNGSVHGIVKLTLWSFQGIMFPEYLLTSALVDIFARGNHGIDVNYEVVGFQGDTIYVMVILTLEENA